MHETCHENSAGAASRLRALLIRRKARLHQTERPNALPASWRCELVPIFKPLRTENKQWSLGSVDGLVDRRFSVARDSWKGERMPQHRFPPPVFLG